MAQFRLAAFGDPRATAKIADPEGVSGSMPSRFKCLLMEPFGTSLSTLSGQKPNVCRIKTTAWFPTLSFDLRAHGFESAKRLPQHLSPRDRTQIGRRQTPVKQQKRTLRILQFRLAKRYVGCLRFNESYRVNLRHGRLPWG